jgi:hypothetical protein
MVGSAFSSVVGVVEMTFLLTQWKLVLIGVLLALLGVQQVRIDHAHKQYAQLEARIAEERQRAAEAARIAEQEAREEEQRREQRKQEIIDAVEERTELAKAAATGAERALGELQRKYAALASAVRKASSDTSPAKPSETTSDPIGVFAIVLGRLGERAKVVERFADGAHIAGLACEQYADGLQPTAR